MGFMTPWVSIKVHTEPEEIEKALEEAVELAGQRLKEMRARSLSSTSELKDPYHLVLTILPPEDWEFSQTTISHIEVLTFIGRKVGISVTVDYGSAMKPLVFEGTESHGEEEEPREERTDPLTEGESAKETLERLRREGRARNLYPALREYHNFI